MEGKVALVTGSTSGIGLGIARCLANRGCNVIITGFGEQDLVDQIVTELSSKVKVTYIGADLAELSQIETLYQKILQVYPEGLDILVNCAGFNLVGRVEDYPVEQWNVMIAVLLSAPFHLTKMATPHMKRKGWGRIVNISSIHGMISSMGKAVYSAAKHGVIGLTKGVAIELGGTGVTCNDVCPAWVQTPLIEAQFKTYAREQGITLEECKKRNIDLIPNKKMVQISEVAEMVAYLCSDVAASITGSSMVVDGGYLAL